MKASQVWLHEALEVGRESVELQPFCWNLPGRPWARSTEGTWWQHDSFLTGCWSPSLTPWDLGQGEGSHLSPCLKPPIQC